jgi:orotidine-5'-phosphate decarboxylase
MDRAELFRQIVTKKSFLCIGLDTDMAKIPETLLATPDPVFYFNQAIIAATHDLCVAYKPNLAFYESLGVQGWKSLEKTIAYLRSIRPEIFVIADAKRSDIGNTSTMYARAFFDRLEVDAVTVVPYMGKDSVEPFLTYPDKWAILLALTSNQGAFDFQFLKDEKTSALLFESVLHISQSWGSADNLMYVVGATHAAWLKRVRSLVPEHFLLVPGIGAQQGDLAQVAEYGMNDHCGLLVNASRTILYASAKKDFASKARAAAKKLQESMEKLLEKAGLI